MNADTLFPPTPELPFTNNGIKVREREILINHALRIGMIWERFAVDEVFNDVTATLA